MKHAGVCATSTDLDACLPKMSYWNIVIIRPTIDFMCYWTQIHYNTIKYLKVYLMFVFKTYNAVFGLNSPGKTTKEYLIATW